jgi:hypothetical protein
MDVTLDDTLQNHLADIKPTNAVGTLAGGVARDVLPLSPGSCAFGLDAGDPGRRRFGDPG